MESSTVLPDSVQRVVTCLQQAGHSGEVVMLAETGKTSAEAAAGLGCSVAEIAKSVVFRRLSDDAAVMVVASGANRVDEHKVAAHTGPLGKANAAFVREKTGYAIGGVCPVGHPTALIMLIDQDLFRYSRVWAAAGHPHAVFPLTPQQLQQMTGAPLADIAQQ
ncbi:YbaK/EbsC family protein [Undibacterium squillarum]|uniref:YbaK/EbsC family protein n=1 Tax=Undibacterium squillarum TaxID=1131567 RepID=UPI0035AEF8E7